MSDGGAVERSFAYNYDAASQLMSAGDSLYTYTYDYDLAGRLTLVSNVGSVGVPEVALNYSYDRQNNLTSVTDTINGVEAGIETFEYDRLDRVTRITQSGTGVSEKAVTFAYDAASQLTQLDSFSDLAQTQLVASSRYSYDLAGRLELIEQSNDGGAIAEYRYQYDAANRITELVSIDGVSSFSYDERSQLISAEHSFQTDEVYTYDANGNRTNDGSRSGPDNRLLEDEQFLYDYDNEGNRIRQTDRATGEVTEYEFDHRNQLRAVVTRDSNGNTILSAEYDYDVFGRRILRTVDSDGDGALAAQTERFVYDGEHIALVFDGEGNLAYRYLHGPAIDRVLAQEDAEGTVLFALTNHLGSVRDLVDAEGNVVNHLTYDSFGNITSQSNPEVEFRFSYAGREFDDETGLFYNRARYLDPSTGQFISQDPLGFGAGDTNLYRYVFNNPLSFNDPSGLQAFVPTLSLNDQDFDGRDDSSEPGAIDLDGDGEIDDSGLASELFGSALAGLSILRAPASPINLPSPTPIELTPDVGDANTPSQLPDIPVDLPSLEGIPLGENIGQILVLGNDAIQTAQDIADAILESTDLDAAREIIENSHILLSETPNSGVANDPRIRLTNMQDPDAQDLASSLGGQASVEIDGFGNREFDAVSDQFIAQAFGPSEPGATPSFQGNPSNFLSKSRRTQIRTTLDAAASIERDAFFRFRGGTPDRSVLDFISRNAQRRNVNFQIEVID
ncbi:RHS repeat domain-containing protein [Synechococcus sp. PCC 7336]|uniref:RHS repeat domain-containing protein n=1 Tax=Synechococcus sp. PCC 7336 TaxID=195250 RepID=UPI00034872AE|nr:RHS repeat-associated core domain-containing protein [Synechococcus sp. PCC 7336]